MGHHAQYRKRGSTPQPRVILFPPPAPLLTHTHPNVIVTPQGDDDTGGHFWIEASDTEGGTIINTVSGPWVDPMSENESTWSLPTWLRAWEEGNHLVYEGMSTKSSWLHLT